MLGLRCCAWFSLVGTSRGYSSLLCTDFSCGGFFFFSFLFSFKILFLIEEKFHYNIVLVYVIHQHESAISVHMYSPSWTSLRPHSSCPSRFSQITKLGSLCYTAASHWLFHRYLCIYVNTTFSIRPTLSFPRCVHKSFLYIQYDKAVYCHPVYLTCIQSPSSEMPGWMSYKLESRLPGEISTTSDMQMIPL